jgi:P-type E1-E2 ATPase
MGFAQKWRASREVQDLLSRIRHMAHVRRDGVEKVIPAAEVVRGDILILRAGDLVPADARILVADTLFAIEAPLTGEPFPVKKNLSLFSPPQPWPPEALHFGLEPRSALARVRQWPF